MADTYQEVESLVYRGESKTLEFKKSTSKISEGCKSLAAFLNSEGGTLLIGVTDGGEIQGQTVSDKTKLDIDKAVAKIEPIPSLEIGYVNVPDTQRQVISLRVGPDKTKQPFLYDGRGYIRGEAGNRRMTQEEMRYFSQANTTGNHWEEQANKVSLSELDVKRILNTIEVGVRNDRIPEDFSTDDPWQALEHLQLIRDGKLSNAAVILFARNPEKYFPQCLLRLARFRGTDKSCFIDNKQVHGNIFELIRAATSFASNYLPITSTFPMGQLERHDEPLFPIEAIREAIVNAFCHRNYAYQGGSVSFAIYDDRLEIWSYGELPLGMTLDKLMANDSIRRNPRIAKVLYYHKLFESWGRGIQKVIKLCVESGHPEPFFKMNSGGLLLTIPSREMIGAQKSAMQLPGLTKRQTDLINLLQSDDGQSSTELRAKLVQPPTIRTVFSDLNHLYKMGLIRGEGSTRMRRWFLVKK